MKVRTLFLSLLLSHLIPCLPAHSLSRTRLAWLLLTVSHAAQLIPTKTVKLARDLKHADLLISLVVAELVAMPGAAEECATILAVCERDYGALLADFNSACTDDLRMHLVPVSTRLLAKAKEDVPFPPDSE